METKIIGVTPLYCDEKESIWMLPGYMDMLREAGLLPIILPTRATPKELNRLNGICDGYLFTGGHDVDPALYGVEKSARCGEVNPDRDMLEQALFRLALDTDKPILGICRGIQLINAVLGGTLYQDLETERPSSVDHHMTPPYDRHIHQVTLQPGGLLSAILREQTIGVNSYHHQAIQALAECLRVEAISEDGLIEGVSCPGKRFVLAVQWHPEFSYRTDVNSRAIVRAFADTVSAV